MKLEDITRIVEGVRRQFDRKKVNKERLIERLKASKIAADENEIASTVDRAIEGFPHKACFVACLYLNMRLRHRGLIVIGSYNEKPHTYIALDGNIVDITADQFGGPKVYVGPRKKP